MTTQTKITEDDVRAMRKRHEAGEGPAALGEAFGISKAAAWRIVTYRSWTNVAPEPTPLVEVPAEESTDPNERYAGPDGAEKFLEDAQAGVVLPSPEPKSEATVKLLEELEERARKRAAKREYMRAWRKAQGAKEKPGPERSAPCGTRSGYKAHLKYGEPTCAPCRKAHVDWQKDNRSRKKLQKTA